MYTAEQIKFYNKSLYDYSLNYMRQLTGTSNEDRLIKMFKTSGIGTLTEDKSYHKQFYEMQKLRIKRFYEEFMSRCYNNSIIPSIWTKHIELKLDEDPETLTKNIRDALVDSTLAEILSIAMNAKAERESLFRQAHTYAQLLSGLTSEEFEQKLNKTEFISNIIDKQDHSKFFKNHKTTIHFFLIDIRENKYPFLRQYYNSFTTNLWVHVINETAINEIVEFVLDSSFRIAKHKRKKK